jgi:hypothetical protein
VQLLVGKRTRKRLNANSIVQLVRSFDAPAGILSFLYPYFLSFLFEIIIIILKSKVIHILFFQFSFCLLSYVKALITILQVL